LTLDGVGEWATTSIASGRGTEIEHHLEIRYPHSIGLLYSAFTYFTGFRVNSGEYKLMGLAPYGTPRFADTIRDHLIEFKPDGSYRLNMEYFDYTAGDRMTNDRFAALFDGPERTPESRITRREMDLAASIQMITEEAVIGLARHAKEVTGAKNLCLAGGVALNCVANGVLLRTGMFDDLWIQPAAGDAGGAVGSALAASYEHFGAPRVVSPAGADAQSGTLLGPAFAPPEIQQSLESFGADFRVVDDIADRAAIVAEALDAGKVVGHFSGRAEFGPRSLGSRSIMGDPRNPETQVNMNLKIKYRESFRPFAPSVLRERAPDYFELDEVSPYMLIVAPVRKDRREDVEPVQESDSDDLLGLVAQRRSDIPAITHVDYSARVQTVDEHSNPEFRKIIEAFEARTGCGVVVNTSFNVRGEPIVGSPEDAYTCFMRTEMDMLVVGDFVMEKERQPEWAKDDSWRDEYELD
jgi:carbamoyltransferase